MIRLRLATVTRNRKGQPVRAERRLADETFAIGRGTQCAIHLPDPRVALDHATIYAAERGYRIAAAGGGAAGGGALLIVDGRLEGDLELKPGVHCEVGPYELAVEAPPPDADLAVVLELKRPLPDDLAEIRARSRVSLAATWLGKRGPAWTLFVAVAVAFLALPVVNALMPQLRALSAKWPIGLDTAWNPGPLAAGHLSFGNDCGACHQVPFLRVRDRACLACHERMPGHVRDAAVQDDLFGSARCGSCHQDHQGADGLVRDDPGLCAECHRDLKRKFARTGLRDAADFATAHPEFRLTLWRGPGERDVARVAHADKADFVERSNLKFPHDKHLKPNLKAPKGRVTLDCRQCHVEDKSGRGFVPIEMKKHCQECHSLEFEPAVTTRQVPHGNAEEALLTMREFYANIALNNIPVDVIDVGALGRTIPRSSGSVLSEAERQRAVAWASAKAQRVGADLFEQRVCTTCHAVQRVTGQGREAGSVQWTVAPVRAVGDFLPLARFDHAKHKTFACKDCHDAARSTRSADVLIPDLANCRQCHAGGTPVANKVTSTCTSCHSYHLAGMRPLRAEPRSAQPRPGGPAR